MAIIKCPECGQEMSELVECCPQCGMPMEVIQSFLAQQTAAAKPKDNSASNGSTYQQQNEETVRCPECGKEMSKGAACCPQCGVPMDVIQSLLAQQAAPSEQKAAPINTGSALQQKNQELATAQQQVDDLRQEANRLETTIASQKEVLAKLEAERQHLANELDQARESAKRDAEAQMQSLQEETARLQQQVSALKEEASAQQGIVDTLRAEAEQLNQQMAVAKQTLLDEPKSGKGYKIAVTLLCIAIAATLAWIIWMVVNTR